MTIWTAALMTGVAMIWIAMLAAVALRVRTVDAGERT
jgi:hypothetical protein